MSLTTSEQKSTIMAALFTVQQAIKPVLKDKKNDHFKSRYADLEAVAEEAGPLLMANGILLLQSPGGDASGMTLTTRLEHVKSGEWVQGTVFLPGQQQSPQGFGSAITYARRYALCAMLGIVTTDDDGNAASGREESKPAPQKATASSSQTTPAPSKASGLVFPPFGRQAGQPIAGADIKALEFYAGAARRTLDDDSKAKWHDKERTLLEAYEAELLRRGVVPKEFEGPEHAGDNVSF